MRSNTSPALRPVGALHRASLTISVVSLGVVSLALFCLALVVPAGCGYSNPHGYQDTPPIMRLTTVPAGATVILQDMNLKLETPCDLPSELDPDDEISVSKAGYLPYRGPLSGIPEVARRTFQLELQRVDPTPPRS